MKKNNYSAKGQGVVTFAKRKLIYYLILLASILAGGGAKAQGGTSCMTAGTFIYNPDDMPIETCMSGKVWYKFTAISDTIDAKFTEMAMDTTNMFSKVCVWSGTCSGLSLLTSDTISSLTDSVLTFHYNYLSIGNVYFVEFVKTDTNSTTELKFHSNIVMQPPVICEITTFNCPELIRNGDFEQYHIVNNQLNAKQACGWEEGWDVYLPNNNPYDNYTYGYYSTIGTCWYPTTVYSHPYYVSPDAFNHSYLPLGGNGDVPINNLGNQNSTDDMGNSTGGEGQGYGGFYAYREWCDSDDNHHISAHPFFKEFVYQKLLCDTLVEGVTYNVSFFVSLAENSQYACNHIGMYFFKRNPHWDLPYMSDPYTMTSTIGNPGYLDMVNPNNYLLFDPLPYAATPAAYTPNTMAITPVTPQITQPNYGTLWNPTLSTYFDNGPGSNSYTVNGGYLTDKTNWMKVTGQFTPAAGQGGQYSIVIGNFANNDFVPLDPFSDPSYPDANHHLHCETGANAYYYVDQVSVKQANPASIAITSGPLNSCNIHPGLNSVYTFNIPTGYVITQAKLCDPTHGAVVGIGSNYIKIAWYLSSFQGCDGECFTINVGTDCCDSAYTFTIDKCCEHKDDNGKIIDIGDLGTTTDVTTSAPLNLASQIWPNLGMSLPPGFEIPGPTIKYQTFSINGTFIVDQDLELNECDVWLGHEAKIIVKPGILFQIENSHLHACCNMWNGIEVAGGITPATILTDNSIIEDADSAITSLNGGLFEIGETIFNKNYKGLVIKDATSGWTADEHTVTGSVFTCRDFSLPASSALDLTVHNIGNSVNDLLTIGEYNQYNYPRYNSGPSPGLYSDANFNLNTTGIYPFVTALKPPMDNRRSYSGIDVNNVYAAVPLELGDQTVPSGSQQVNPLNPYGDSTNFQMNTFDFLDFGIRSINSNTAVYNNIFVNIYNLPGYVPSHKAINNIYTAAIWASGDKWPKKKLTVGGWNWIGPNYSQPNLMDNNNNGVYSYKNDNEIINNSVFDVMTYGVMLENGESRTNNVSGNTLGNVNYGIHLFDLDNLGYTNIYANHISVWSYANGVPIKNSFGIGMFNSVPSYSSAITIDSNYIGLYNFDAAHACDGIRMSGNISPNAVIENSHIWAVYNSASASGDPKMHGIWTEDVDAASIHDNFIQNQEPSGLPATANPLHNDIYYGIYNDVTTSTVINYNYTGYLSTGITASSSCLASNYTCNEMSYNYDGFYFNSADIYDQSLMGVSNGNGFDPTFAGPSTSVLYDADGTITTTTYPYWNWDNYQIPAGMYNVASGALIIPFLAGAPNGCTHTPPQHSLVLTSAERERKLGKIMRGENQFSALSSQFLIHDSIYAYRVLSNNTASINIGAADDSLYQNFYARAGAENYGKFEQANQDILLGNYNGAIGLNESIIANNVIEMNQKTVNSILFDQMKMQADTTRDRKYVYDQNQYTMLYNIATQDPILGGEAVFQARTMLWIDPSVTPQHNGNGALFPANHIENRVSTYSLFPNPTTGVMTLQYKLEGTDEALFCIYAMDGRLVKQQTLNASENTAFVNAVELNAGIYYYAVKEKNKSVKVEKLIIVK